MGLRRELVGRLVELILRDRDAVAVEWDDVEISECSEELSDYVNSVRMYQGPEIERVDINLPLFARPPSDGHWIREAVDRKVARYGNSSAVQDVSLVIGALGLVDGAQIAAFRNENLEEDLPFGEIWLVSAYEGAILLKARRS